MTKIETGLYRSAPVTSPKIFRLPANNLTNKSLTLCNILTDRVLRKLHNAEKNWVKTFGRCCQSGSVRPNSPIFRSWRIASWDSSPPQVRKSVSLLQLIARGDPAVLSKGCGSFGGWLILVMNQPQVEGKAR